MTLLLSLPHPIPSPLQRLDARWKLAALLPAAVAVTVIRSPLPALTACAGALLLVALARLPWYWFGPRLGSALLVTVVLAFWLPFVPRADDAVYDLAGVVFSLTGLVRGLTLVAKAAGVVALLLVLLATAPLHETLAAAQGLYLPGWLVQLGLLAYRYVFVLGEEFDRLRLALRVRGYRNRASLHSYRTIGHVAGTLLVRGHERSERVAQAMRCRGFDGQFRSLQAFQTGTGDILFLLAVWLTAGALVAWDLCV